MVPSFPLYPKWMKDDLTAVLLEQSVKDSKKCLLMASIACYTEFSIVFFFRFFTNQPSSVSMPNAIVFSIQSVDDNRRKRNRSQRSRRQLNTTRDQRAAGKARKRLITNHTKAIQSQTKCNIIMAPRPREKCRNEIPDPHSKPNYPSKANYPSAKDFHWWVFRESQTKYVACKIHNILAANHAHVFYQVHGLCTRLPNSHCQELVTNWG